MHSPRSSIPTSSTAFPTERRASRRSGLQVGAGLETRTRAVHDVLEIAPDEALIIEWDNNDLFWMMTNMGMFLNSMDYLYRPVSYSPAARRWTATARSAWFSRTMIRATTTGSTPRASSRGILQPQHADRPDDRLPHARRQATHSSAAMPADSARVTPEQRARQMQSGSMRSCGDTGF